MSLCYADLSLPDLLGRPRLRRTGRIIRKLCCIMEARLLHSGCSNCMVEAHGVRGFPPSLDQPGFKVKIQTNEETGQLIILFIQMFSCFYYKSSLDICGFYYNSSLDLCCFYSNSSLDLCGFYHNSSLDLCGFYYNSSLNLCGFYYNSSLDLCGFYYNCSLDLCGFYYNCSLDLCGFYYNSSLDLCGLYYNSSLNLASIIIHDISFPLFLRSSAH